MESGSVEKRVKAWLEALDDTSYYELLGIPETADRTTVQQAFHLFSTSFHPDQHRGESPEVREGVVRIYQRGTEAYGVLRDPKARAAYDLAIADRHGRVPTSSARSTPSVEGPVDDLISLCETPAGRLHTRQATRALSENQPDEAERLFDKALRAEESNDRLKSRILHLIEYVRSSVEFE